MSLIVFTINK